MMPIPRKLPLLAALESTKNPTPKGVNSIFQIPLFNKENLWNEPGRTAAERLGLSMGSETSYEPAFRLCFL
jgi:hypothetical protein